MAAWYPGISAINGGGVSGWQPLRGRVSALQSNYPFVAGSRSRTPSGTSDCPAEGQTPDDERTRKRSGGIPPVAALSRTQKEESSTAKEVELQTTNTSLDGLNATDVESVSEQISSSNIANNNRDNNVDTRREIDLNDT